MVGAGAHVQEIIVVLELVFLRGEKKISSHAHKTGSGHLLEVLFKISDEQPRPFCKGVPHLRAFTMLQIKLAFWLVKW